MDRTCKSCGRPVDQIDEGDLCRECLEANVPTHAADDQETSVKAVPVYDEPYGRSPGNTGPTYSGSFNKSFSYHTNWRGGNKCCLLLLIMMILSFGGCIALIKSILTLGH